MLVLLPLVLNLVVILLVWALLKRRRGKTNRSPT